MLTDNNMKSLLESTLNTRELGGYSYGSGVTKTGRILRSDRIVRPTDRDISFLKALGITTVIDLRTDEDAAADPCGLTPERGFNYCHFPVEEGGYVPASADDMVPCYLAIAEAANMPGVFRAIAEAPAGVIFNCWAGKDRTGVTAAILLMLCGVSDGDIAENYMLTKPYSEELWKMIRQHRSEDEMQIIIPNERFIYGFIEGFRAKYGSAEGYLSAIGLDSREICAVRDKLCG